MIKNCWKIDFFVKFTRSKNGAIESFTMFKPLKMLGNVAKAYMFAFINLDCDLKRYISNGAIILVLLLNFHQKNS